MNTFTTVRTALGLGVLATVVASHTLVAEEIPFPWQSYTSESGRFTAEFPGDVKVEEKPNATHYHASPPGIDADFRVAITDRDQAEADLPAAYTELRRICRKTCEAQGIEAQNVVEFKFAGNRPARVFDFTKDVGETKAYYRMLFLFDGKRFYQVLYGYALDKPMRNEGERFYKSFKINSR